MELLNTYINQQEKIKEATSLNKLPEREQQIFTSDGWSNCFTLIHKPIQGSTRIYKAGALLAEGTDYTVQRQTVHVHCPLEKGSSLNITYTKDETKEIEIEGPNITITLGGIEVGEIQSLRINTPSSEVKSISRGAYSGSFSGRFRRFTNDECFIGG